MITIDRETEKNRKLVVNFDFFLNRYKTVSQDLTVAGLEPITLEKNFYYLLHNSEIENFDKKYSMHPDYLSFDKYGTVIFAPLLMYINSVACLEDFDLDQVIIPSYSAIVNIAQDRIAHDEPENYCEIN